MLRHRTSALAGLCLATFLTAPPLAAQRLARERIAGIERAISEEMARQKMPALSVAVGKDERLAWSAGFGIADLENSVPAKALTVYRIASLAKPITAVAVMQLAERGKLDLDAPIQKYVPAFPEKPWPITARLLLGHLSGIRHYRLFPDEVHSTRHYTDLLEPLKLFAADPLVFEPGAQFLYSSYGYCLLGAAVEGASGVKFVDYIRENIFVPAGMERSRTDDVQDIIPNRARGYRLNLAGALENCAFTDTSNKIPSGGLVSTVEDLVKFVLALNQGVLVKPETREQMYTAQKTRDGQPAPCGLGFRIQESPGLKWVAHVGDQPGVTAMLASLPAQGFSVVLITNLELAELDRLASRIAGLVVRQ